jgi:hypothetical protein
VSTVWWIVVLWLVSNVCFVGGYVLRAEMELWRRANGQTIDFTQKRVGA